MIAASLYPESISAPCERRRRLGFGLTPRAMLLLVAGFVLLIPGFWDGRLAYAMLAWDGLVLLAALLDGLRLSGPEGEAVVGARKAFALLAYLALQPGRSASRDALAGLLWEHADNAQARVSLRLPESLKSRADEAAARAGQSLNTWLVTLIRGATSERALPVDVDVSSVPFGTDFPFGGARPGGDRRLTGWL